MDLKEQIIREYLEQGCGYRKLQAKYGISRTTICKWVQIYQGIHGLERTTKQQNHYLRDMDDPNKKRLPKKEVTNNDLLKKIEALQKQLQWEKLRADSLDTLINVAEQKLSINIRKKPGSQQSKK
ncbi:MAG TPA: helix-turn-helix domain-containing protein [Bacteroidia bacterium]|nr:helix-turn-helix domain-containing protein [Bacteroidia bacterium]